MAANIRFNLFSSQLGNDDLSTNQLSRVANVSEAEHICIHAKLTGTPSGTLYLDISVGIDSGPDGLPVTWEEFDAVPFAAQGSQMWLDKDIPYNFVRLRWEQTGGAGTIVAILSSKGDL